MRPSWPTYESVKEEKKQAAAQKEMREMVRSLLAGLLLHSPPLEKDGSRVSNMRAVPVGKRLAKFPADGRDLMNDASILYFGPERGKFVCYTEKECFLCSSIRNACMREDTLDASLYTFLKDIEFFWCPNINM